MIEDFTIDNDISSSTAGQDVPCNLWKHSPVAQALEFAQKERESVIDLREMVGAMSIKELEFLTEWTSDVLSAALAERRMRIE